jgi:hypothetical protein
MNQRLDGNKTLLRTGRVSALTTAPEGVPIDKAAISSLWSPSWERWC